MLSGFKISSASFSISSCVFLDNVVLVALGVEVEVGFGVEAGVETELEFEDEA